MLPAGDGEDDMTAFPEAGADVHAAMLAIVAEQDAAWGAGDAEAFCARATPDIVFTNIVGMFSVGDGPFLEQHRRIFTTIYRGSKLRQTLANLALLRPDVVIVDTMTELSGYGALPPGAQPIDGALRTRLEQVIVRVDGRWSIAAFHNVPVNPAALAPPAR